MTQGTLLTIGMLFFAISALANLYMVFCTYGNHKTEEHNPVIACISVIFSMMGLITCLFAGIINMG